MSGPGCRLDKVPADYMVPGLDDIALQTAIYANLPWAKGFHSVPQTEPVGGVGSVSFDNICHEDGYTTWRFMATGYNRSGYWGVIELTKSTSRWGEKQLRLYENLSGWMKMDKWGRKTVLGYGAMLGLARMVDKIRNDPSVDARIKEDVNAYFNAMPYYINEELGRGNQGIAALAMPFAPVPSHHAIPVYKKSGNNEVWDHNADVLAVLKTLEDKARSSGEYGNAEFAKVLMANYFLQVLLVTDGDRQKEAWEKARTAFAAIDPDKLVDVRQRGFYELIAEWFNIQDAYCDGVSYLGEKSFECMPCRDVTIDEGGVIQKPMISTPDGHGCVDCPDGTEPNKDLRECVFIASAQSCAGREPSQDYDAKARICVDSALSCAKRSLPFDDGSKKCGNACNPNENLKEGKCARKVIMDAEDEE